MGHEILPASSPAHRRLPNPSSPSPFRRSGSTMREDADLSCRALIHRHQFLLLMLALLFVLCLVYLYFAITLGASQNLHNPARVSTRSLLQFSQTDDDVRRVVAKHKLQIEHGNVASCEDLISASTSTVFDVVYCNIHQTQTVQILRKISGHVRKGGYLFVNGLDVSKAMLKLNWSLVARDSEYQIWKAPDKSQRSSSFVGTS